MANGIWEPIRKPIKKQIEKRQSLMLQNSDYSQRVTYLNKRCDIRVTPLSYDITNPENYPSFVFNNDYMEGIIGNTYKNQKERPFIENFELENKTGGDDKVGVLRKGRISLKIFTKEQFNQIEKYFRIGSAILIEWGWSKYVLSSGNSGYFKSHLYSKFTDKILEESDILNHISTQTLESEGNYDAAVMFINNFSINFENSTNDYFYTLNIDFVGKSLLLNEIVTTNQEGDGSIERKLTNSQDQVFSNPLINYLRFLEQLKSLNDFPQTEEIYITSEGEDAQRIQISIIDLLLKSNTTPGELFNLGDIYSKEASNILFQSQIETDTKPTTVKSTSIPDSAFTNPYGTIVPYTNSTNIYSYNYIRLEYFLRLLEPIVKNKYNSLEQEYIIPEFPSLKNIHNELDYQNSARTDRARVKNELGEDRTEDQYIYNQLNTFGSFDPRICFLPYQITSKLLNIRKIKDIYLRITYLKNILIDFYKSENSNFNNILTTIINDINKATADELKLEYSSTENDKEYTIVSGISNIIPTLDYLAMKAYNVGSIMEEVTIDTSIDSKIASTVAIGSLGQKLNEIQTEAVGLLKFNKNIESRLKINNLPEINSLDERNKLYTRLAQNIFKITDLTGELTKFTTGTRGIIFNNDSTFIDLINTFKKLRTDATQKTLLKNSNNPPFSRNTPLIPIKYNFSIPGLSGLYITNVFRIEDERLPDIYKTSQSYFIITGVKHTINNRDWKTSISTNFQLS
jgi:hypothetical protein